MDYPKINYQTSYFNQLILQYKNFQFGSLFPSKQVPWQFCSNDRHLIVKGR